MRGIYGTQSHIFADSRTFTTVRCEPGKEGCFSRTSRCSWGDDKTKLFKLGYAKLILRSFSRSFSRSLALHCAFVYCTYKYTDRTIIRKRLPAPDAGLSNKPQSLRRGFFNQKAEKALHAKPWTGHPAPARLSKSHSASEVLYSENFVILFFCCFFWTAKYLPCHQRHRIA